MKRKWFICISLFGFLFASGWIVNEQVVNSNHHFTSTKGTKALPLSTDAEEIGIEISNIPPAFKSRQYVRISTFQTENISIAE